MASHRGASRLDAVVFAKCEPPTEETRTAIGVLFLLTHEKEKWRITDQIRFIATGKYADVDVKLVGLDSLREGAQPPFTITETQGGRGNCHDVSETYDIDNFDRFKRLSLE